MGNATFWYYPGGKGTPVEKIDLGEGISDLQITPLRDATTATTFDGTQFRSSQASKLSVRIVLDRFNSEDLAQNLMSMWSHLELGGACAFAADASTAFAATLTAIPSRGDTTLYHSGNLFSAWSGSNPVANDFCYIQTGNPGLIREVLKVHGSTASTSSTVEMSNSVRYNYSSAAQMMIRQRDFYPYLVAPQEAIGSSPVTHDHRISWTLDFALVEDTGALSSFGDSSLVTGEETLGSSIGSGGLTLEELVDANYTSDQQIGQ